MSNQIYVIVEAGFEYNDNYFYAPECGGGNPIKYYNTAEEASKACQELNDAARIDADPQDYDSGYGSDFSAIEFYYIVTLSLGD
jgi:hypothetical protein